MEQFGSVAQASTKDSPSAPWLFGNYHPYTFNREGSYNGRIT